MGPRGDPRHGRGADARRRGGPRRPRAHRSAGGQLGQPHRPPRRHRRRPGRGDARRRRRGHRRRRRVPGRRGLHDHRRHRARGPGAAARRVVAGAAQRGASRSTGSCSKTRARPDAGVPPRLPGRPVGDLPADGRRAGDRAAHRSRRRGPRPRRARRADPLPGRAGHARRALRGLPRRPPPAVPVHQRGVRLPRRRGRAPGRGPRLRRRGDRRHLRARRAHQARRTGARRRPADHAGRAVLLLPGRRRHAVLPRRRAGRRAHRSSWSSAR